MILPKTIFHVVGLTMVVALGHIRFVLYVATANLLVNFGVSIALVHPFGVEGVILGTIVAQALAWPPLLWFFFREFGVRLGEWLRQVVLPAVPGFLAQAVTAGPLLYLANRSESLGVVVILASLSVVLAAAAYYLVGLAREQRRLLKTTFQQAVGLRSAA